MQEMHNFRNMFSQMQNANGGTKARMNPNMPGMPPMMNALNGLIMNVLRDLTSGLMNVLVGEIEAQRRHNAQRIEEQRRHNAMQRAETVPQKHIVVFLFFCGSLRSQVSSLMCKHFSLSSHIVSG